MRGLKWESVAAVLFYTAMTLIAGYISTTLRDLNLNVSELKTSMAVVVTEINQNKKDTSENKSEIGELKRGHSDHEARIRVLEKK